MFYSNIFDPLLVVSQICLLQSLFYLAVGCWLLLFSLSFGTPLTLHSILAPTSLQLFRSTGWTPLGAFLLVAPMIGYCLLLIVGRAKQCLDFTLTIYFVHFVFCTFYQGIPFNWEWWVVNTVSCILIVVMGEYLCLQKELEAIPMTAEERELRERGRKNKESHHHSESSSSSASMENAHPNERMSLMNEERAERGVVTTTIRLTPNNVFNV